MSSLQCQALAKRLAVLARIKGDMMNLDQKTIAVLKSYSHPPGDVDSVMSATLLLLGCSEKEISTWQL